MVSTAAREVKRGREFGRGTNDANVSVMHNILPARKNTRNITKYSLQGINWTSSPIRHLTQSS